MFSNKEVCEIMNTEYIIVNGELYHYGVPGMRWGHRKREDIERAKQGYKDAKREYKLARKEIRKGPMFVRTKDIDSNKARADKLDKAYLNRLEAKAQLKAAKAKNSQKAYDKTYIKEMSKYGLVGSAYDVASNSRTTKIYNSLKAKKGKEYADKVHKKLAKQSYATLAASATVALGSAIVVGILEAKKN